MTEPSVIHHDVKATEDLCSLLEEALDLIAIGHVTHDRVNRRAPRAESLGGLAQAALMAV